MNAPCNIILLHGGRGWGKTEAQLMRFRKYVGIGYGTHWRGVIYDREYKNLDDLIVKSKRLFKDLDGDDASFLSSNSALKWVWSTGEELLFRVAKDEDDYWSYHGHEYPFIGWNELTKYANAKLYRKMMSINRSGFDPVQHTPRVDGGDNWLAELSARYGREVNIGDYDTPNGNPLPPIPLEVVATTNPYGVGHNWVKQEFIDPAPDGRIVRKQYEIFNPQTQREETIERSQVAIFGSFKENPYLSPVYIAGLYEETDENIIKAWIHGDWDIVAGGAFDDVYRKSIHVLPRFPVPAGWRVDRAFDWGSTHPFSVGWFAEANGEEVTFVDSAGRPRTFCPPPGTIIQIAELYGAKQIGTNEGVKWTAAQIAKAIKQVERGLLDEGWITRKPYPGPADNQIRDVREADVDTIESKMADEGILWEHSDKSRGSRKVGLELLRTRLLAARKGEGPGWYWMANCVASIATIPVLPRDEKDMDDVDTSAEDHAYDMNRYRALKASNRLAKKLVVKMPS